MFEFKQRWNDDRASKRKQAEQSRQSVVEAEAAVATTNRFKWKHVNTRKHAHYTYSRSLGRSVSSIRAHTYAQEWADVRALAPKNTHTCTHMYTHTPPIEWLRIYRNYFMCFSLYFISECSYSLSLSHSPLAISLLLLHALCPSVLSNVQKMSRVYTKQ